MPNPVYSYFISYKGFETWVKKSYVHVLLRITNISHLFTQFNDQFFLKQFHLTYN